MTNVFVGFHDQRSCSRILKPPGGGTSDIFGNNARKTETPVKIIEETPQTPSNEVVEKPTEQIEEPAIDHHDSKNGMNGHSESTKPEDLKVEELALNEEIKEEKITAEIVSRKEECKMESHSEETTKTKLSKQKIDTIAGILQQDDIEVAGVQKKNVKSPNRVPPGGYSSGLW